MSGKSVSTSETILYFAYGSNMHLTQMADRCPGSIFKGKGRLLGYRWQINERGVANIVESRSNYVEGVIYEIDKGDRRQLDRNEGVGRGYYSAEYLQVQFTPSVDFGEYKTGYVAKLLKIATIPRHDVGENEGSSRNAFSKAAAPDIRQTMNQDSVLRQCSKSGAPTTCTASKIVKVDHGKKINALVYISEDYKTDGSIRTEYIARMEKAIVDGQKLGLSHNFLEQLDKCIHHRHPPPQECQRTQASWSETQDLPDYPKARSGQYGDSDRKHQRWNSKELASAAHFSCSNPSISSRIDRASREHSSVGIIGTHVEVRYLRCVVTPMHGLNKQRERSMSCPL